MSRGDAEQEGIADVVSQHIGAGKSRVGTAILLIGSIGAATTLLFAAFWPQPRTSETTTTNLASTPPGFAGQLEAAGAAPVGAPAPPVVEQHPTSLPLAAGAPERGLGQWSAGQWSAAQGSPAQGSMSRTHGVLDLREVDFQGADLAWGMFTKIDLERANFSTARLIHASFKGANLRAVQFGGSDCSGADFRFANVDGASFTAANLSRANFKGVDLRDTIGLTTEQVNNACWDAATRLPAGVAPSFFDCTQLP